LPEIVILILLLIQGIIKRLKNKLQYLSSFIFPKLVTSFQSPLNDQMFVYYSHGKYMLNSANGNYSYGALHSAFRKVFIKLGFDRMKFNQVLLLGFGAGSIVAIIQEEFNMDCQVVAVDKDPLVIEAAKKYFNIDRFRNLEIKLADARDFVSNCKTQFDLITFDIYIDNEIPFGFESREFLLALKHLLAPKGYLVFNKNLAPLSMRENLPKLTRFFDNIYPGYSKIWVGSSSLFFIYKKK
jgi:spermidine synthase